MIMHDNKKWDITRKQGHVIKNTMQHTQGDIQTRKIKDT